MPAQNLHRADEGGTYLHVFNRGIENSTIFRDEADFQVFLSFIGEYLSPPKDVESTKKEFKVKGRVFKGVPHQPKNYTGKVELFAYNLEPNHFHLIIHQKTAHSLQGFVRSLLTRYSMYFNKKYARTGTLFAGPYKSVRLNDDSLLLLTRYLHQSGEYSSYHDYLKLKKTPWVKTKVVLSIENDEGNHKDFVENYKLSTEEETLLKSISLEDTSGHLERRDPAEIAPKKSRRVLEFFAAFAVFALLFGAGFRNVALASTQPISPQPNIVSNIIHNGIRLDYDSFRSLVLAKTSETWTLVSGQVINFKDMAVAAIPQKELAPKDTSAVAVTLGEATPEAKIALTIKQVDATIINIREKPTTASKKIGEAKAGDSFESVSKKSGWYEVKLPDNSTGFISSKYVEIGERGN